MTSWVSALQHSCQPAKTKSRGGGGGGGEWVKIGTFPYKVNTFPYMVTIANFRWRDNNRNPQILGGTAWDCPSEIETVGNYATVLAWGFPAHFISTFRLLPGSYRIEATILQCQYCGSAKRIVLYALKEVCSVQSTLPGSVYWYSYGMPSSYLCWLR